MRHAGTQTLETDRLFLRQLLPEDAEQMYTNWASDPEVTRFLRWEPHKNALETVGLLAAWATFTRTRTTTSGPLWKRLPGRCLAASALQCSAR